MSASEIDRLTTDLNTNAKLREHLSVLGHDTGAFVSVANRLGYKFSEDDLNAHILSKQANLSQQRAKILAAGVAGVTSTVTQVKTAAVGVTTAVGATKVGGAVIAVEVAVVT